MVPRPGGAHRARTGKAAAIKTDSKNEIHCHGLQVYRTRHSRIRELKHEHSPATFGFRIWQSSWLLIDYLTRQGLPDGLSVLDVGCGWGLAGIYCAKNHLSRVTCLDNDPEVFPYVNLHAEVNQVEVATRLSTIDQAAGDSEARYDLVIGADICFWDEMVVSLETLIRNSRSSGAGMVVLADPGRVTFTELERHCAEQYGGQAMNWKIERPYAFAGRILKIGSVSETHRKAGHRPENLS